MTATTESTKRKLSLLQLAEELGNVSKACQIMGYHRDTFYEVRRAFQVGGVAGLVEQKRGPKSPHPNRVAPEIEEQILALCLERPTYGAQRIANELRLQNVDVSPSGVRGVWLRHDLASRHQRLLRLETHAQDDTVALSDEQIRLLERHSCEFRMRHVEVSAPGELLNQDTFYWGTLKGVGKIYVQVVVDAFCSLAFAKVYTSKMPITAAELLYDRVLPFYEALGVPVQGVLTDRVVAAFFATRTVANTAVVPSGIPTSCCSPCTTSSIAEPRSAARGPTPCEAGHCRTWTAWLRRTHEPHAAG